MSEKILNSSVELFEHLDKKKLDKKRELESSKYYNVAMVVGYDNVEYSERFPYIDKCIIIKDVTKVSDDDLELVDRIMKDVSSHTMRAGKKKLYVL